MRILFSLLIFVSVNAFALEPSEREESLDFQSVVSISANDVDGKGEEAIAFCVGTLISPHYLITAAHCIRGNVVLKENKLKVATGYYKYVQNKQGKTVRIGYVEDKAQVLSYTAYFTKEMSEKIRSRGASFNIGPSEDVVLVHFQQPVAVPENFQFAKIISQKNFRGMAKIVTNYLPRVVVINFIEEMSLDTKRSGTLNNMKWASAGHWESKSGVRVEPGDSGSPMFVRIGAEWYLAGVTKGRGQTIFSNWDVYVGLDQKICDLQAKASVQLSDCTY